MAQFIELEDTVHGRISINIAFIQAVVVKKNATTIKVEGKDCQVNESYDEVMQKIAASQNLSFGK